MTGLIKYIPKVLVLIRKTKIIVNSKNVLNYLLPNKCKN